MASQLTDGDRLILQTVEVPQANDLIKVFRVAELVARGAAAAHDVAKELAIVEREGAYYLSAARAIRLLRADSASGPLRYVLGYLGEIYLAANKHSRPAVIVRGTLAAPHVVYVAERIRLQTPLCTPTPRELHDVDLVEQELITLGPLSGSTPRRRASSLVSWMKTVDRLAKNLA